METKLCNKCHNHLPLENFRKYAKKCKDGLHYYWYGHCKKCQNKMSSNWVKKTGKKPEYDRANYNRHKEEIRRKQKEYNENPENKKRKREQDNTYSSQHREERSQRARDWYRDNKERAKASHKEYKKEHPEIIAAHHKIRKARKRGSGVNISPQDWIDICKKYGNKCLKCGRDGISLTLDHIIPISLGGKTTIDNIQPLCASCNSSKKDRTFDYRPHSDERTL